MSNNNRRGDLVFWSVSDLNTTKEQLEKLGFDAYVPRNDFKTALIKSLKIVTKGNDKLYRRFADVPHSVSFGVFEQESNGDDIRLKKEHVVRLDKDHGNLHWATDRNSFSEDIARLYKQGKDNLDSNQFRALVLKVVKQELYGVSMRPGGGVYFVEKAFDHKRPRIEKLFSAFPQATLFSVPIYGDSSTLDALEAATSSDIFGDIEALVQDIERRFKGGVITRRQLEGDKMRANAIVEKVKVHAQYLRTESVKVEKRLNQVITSLNSVTRKVEDGTVEPGEFLGLLKGL